MLTSLNPVFRLHAWTIRKHNGKFYISDKDHPSNWGKAYPTLTRACNAVARKLEKEWSDRAQRYQQR